jgi:DNA-binding Lrp family transcriptional regulator
MPRQTKLSLVPDASMSGVELSGFYQTPNHMAVKAIQAKLTSADWCVWSYLQMIDPFGDRFVDIPNPQEIAETVGLSEKSVKRSIHKLEELGFYDTQIIAMKGKNLAGKSIRADKKLDKVVPKKTKLSETGQSCPQKDKVVPKKTKLSETGQSCPNQPPEPSPSKAFEVPHTIHTYSDLKNTTEDTNCGVLKKFEEKLRYCGIHLYVFDENSEIKNYAGNGISPNPLMKGIREILKGMEEEEAERAIATFLTWLSTAKNVRCKYAAFASALRSKWKG